MSADLNKLNQIIQQLSETDQQAVVNFASYLAFKKKQDFDLKSFYESLPEDDEPLSPEEIERLSQPDEFISWEEAKHELRTERESK